MEALNKEGIKVPMIIRSSKNISIPFGFDILDETFENLRLSTFQQLKMDISLVDGLIQNILAYSESLKKLNRIRYMVIKCQFEDPERHSQVVNFDNPKLLSVNSD